MKSLIEFIQEQDLISHRRLTGSAPPWTDDPVMASYKFGNVRRELDRTNRLLYHLFRKEKWAEECPVLRAKPRLVANCLVHRLVSCHDFSQRHSLFSEFSHFKSAYEADRRNGLAVRPTSFTSCMSDQNLLKCAELAFALTTSLAEVISDSGSLEAAFFHLKSVVGKFTAWQAALDCVMYGWVENTTGFVHLGPGADFTIGLLDMGPKDFGYDHLVAMVNEHLGYLPLRYEEVEGLLCEYGRYVKYNTKWPGKYRLFTPDARPLKTIPLDKILVVAITPTIDRRTSA